MYGYRFVTTRDLLDLKRDMVGKKGINREGNSLYWSLNETLKKFTFSKQKTSTDYWIKPKWMF